MLVSNVILLLTPTLAAAKLWGWPDDFSIHVHSGKQNWPMKASSLNTADSFWMCPGFGDWCEKLESLQCQQLQHYKSNQGWDWGSFIYLQKDGAAWLNLWKDGDHYNVYEQDGDGQIHGQCKAEGNHFACDGGVNFTWWVTLRLHCWQW